IDSVGAGRWPDVCATGMASRPWMEWQTEAKTLDALAAYGWSFNFLVLNDGSKSLEGMFVTRDYFRVLGLQPVLGRTFLESETQSPTAPVIIIGYDVWQRQFNG